MQASPKFYFSDVGVVNILAHRGRVEDGSDLYGKALENWAMHELSAYNAYAERYAEISYWRLASGSEVDFIVNDMELAVEVKASRRVTSDHLKGLRTLVSDHPEVKRRILVCLEGSSYKTQDGIEVMPVRLFARKLWEGEVF